jgi:hypothetical protein
MSGAPASRTLEVNGGTFPGHDGLAADAVEPIRHGRSLAQESGHKTPRFSGKSGESSADSLEMTRTLPRTC